MAADPDGKFTYKISDDLPEDTLSPEEFKEHDEEVMSFGFKVNLAFSLPREIIDARIWQLTHKPKKQRMKRRKK